MGEPVVCKALTFAEVLEEVKKKGEEAKKKFEENGGMCISCGENPGDTRPNTVDPFCCEKCNDETQKLIDQLPGLQRFNIPI